MDQEGIAEKLALAPQRKVKKQPSEKLQARPSHLPFWASGEQSMTEEEASKRRKELRLHPNVQETVERWRKTTAPAVKSSEYLRVCEKMYHDMIEDRSKLDDRQDETKDDHNRCETMSGAHFMDAILRWYARPPWPDENAAYLWKLFHPHERVAASPLPAPASTRCVSPAAKVIVALLPHLLICPHCAHQASTLQVLRATRSIVLRGLLVPHGSTPVKLNAGCSTAAERVVLSARILVPSWCLWGPFTGPS